MAYNTNADRLLNKTATNLDQSLGKYGITFHADLSSNVETIADGIAIQCLKDCEFTKLVVSGIDLVQQIASASSIPLTAGTIIYGNVTNVITAGGNETQLAIIYNK